MAKSRTMTPLQIQREAQDFDRMMAEARSRKRLPAPTLDRHPLVRYGQKLGILRERALGRKEERKAAPIQRDLMRRSR